MLDVDAPVGRTETATRLRYLEPGLTLSVSDLTDTLGGYTCHLVEVEGRTLWIDLPMRRDGMLTLSVGQLVTVRFDRADDAVYIFDSVVSEQRDDDRAPFGIAIPVTINRRSRRITARLSLVVGASFDIGEERDLPATVVDVSAGGVGLICDRELPIGTDLRVRFELPGPDEPALIDEPATVQTGSLYGRTPGGRTLHQYGLRFTRADEGTRERILDVIIWNLTASAPG